jgi:phosphonate transport system substrate-binding protein
MTQQPAVKHKSAIGGPVAFVIFLCLIAGGVFAYFYYTNQPPSEPEGMMGFRAGVEQQEQFMKLAAGYTDANGDLIADRPAGPGLNPDVLVFSEIGSADLDKDEAKWKPFMAHLAKVTGKKVVYWRPEVVPSAEGAVAPEEPKSASTPARPTPNAQAQMKELREHKLHVTAFNTGAVTGAVNTAGFVPMFCPGEKDGKFGYEMEIIVPADSGAQKPEDLRGKNIGLVSLSSNSGGRAGLVYLKSIGLTPVKDYKFVLTGTHAASMREVVEKRLDAACVANDLLKAELDAGRIKPEQIRSIYKSQTFPPLCFGVGHDLDPGLASKIKEAFASFSELPSVYGNSPNRAKFAPVDYKRDWAFVREVDGKLKGVLD